MKRILVIGYGHPNRADDAAGYRVALAYQQAIPPADVHVIAQEMLKPQVIEEMAQADAVIFIDSSAAAGEPGAIAQQQVVPDADANANGVFAQPLTPARALEACRFVYRRTPPTHLLSVRGENYGFGTRLSPAVEAAVPELLARLAQIVAAALSGSETAAQ